MRNPARALAADVLDRVHRGAYVNAVLDAELSASKLSERDRALVTELVYGVLRHQRACDHLVSLYLRSKAGPRTRTALRIGAYQLYFLRQPPHAAVSTAASLAPAHAARLVNAVLRRLAADIENKVELQWPDEGTRLGYPDWLLGRLEEDLGHQDAIGALDAMNHPTPTPLRADGYAQDLASQWVAEAVGARSGEIVVDCCAAPGGKSTALLQTSAGPPALVVAAEANRGRARRMARRVGGGPMPVVIADARFPGLRPGCADKVLVDAPCSGLGALRRRPDARWRLRESDISDLAELQKEILAASLPLVKDGGEFTYSVCTMTRAETVEIDRWLADNYPSWTALDPPGPPWVPLGRGALLLPQAAGTDGMYLLRLSAGRSKQPR